MLDWLWRKKVVRARHRWQSVGENRNKCVLCGRVAADCVVLGLEHEETAFSRWWRVNAKR
jgi:hypothetical protein